MDEGWFQHATTGRVLDLELKLCPAEETIWQKAFILERDRCDVADVAHLFRHRGSQLDWRRLLARFGDHWRVLFAQIVFFDFIYPGHRDQIPSQVRKELAGHAAKAEATEAERQCFGTLLSATQYLHDVDLEDYEDTRPPPNGPICEEHLAVWTANFMKPK